MISLTLMSALTAEYIFDPEFSRDLINNVSKLYYQLSNFNAIYTTRIAFAKLDKDHETPVLDETME